MTTYFNFQPDPNSNYTFQPTLDGSPYSANVTWLMFGQRWYLSVFALNGTLIFNKALIGSPSGVKIESLSWSNGYVVASTQTPHGYRTGQQIRLTLSGNSPAAYNGMFDCIILDGSTFTYPLNTNPGLANGFGMVTYDINLVWGYFDTSTLIYRTSSKQFEVTP